MFGCEIEQAVEQIVDIWVTWDAMPSGGVTVM